MSDEERLLAEIRADPAADGPREVYADILVARGEPRGEYIAIELSAARGTLTDAQRERRAVLVRSELTWANQLGLDAFSVVWRRGFPDVLIGSDEAVIAAREAVGRLPIRVLALMRTTKLADLAVISELSYIQRMSLHGPYGEVWQPVPSAGIAALCEAELPLLVELQFDEGALDDVGAALVGAARWQPQLAALHMIAGTVAGYGFERLFQRPWPNLRELRIVETRLDARAIAAITSAELPRLERIAVSAEDDQLRHRFGHQLAIV